MKLPSKHSLLLFFKGMAMGAADSVPGVSGGTIAFITNIYEELIHSIRLCDWQALKKLFQQGPRAAWQHINGNFLFTLGLGIVLSVLLFANIVGFLLANYSHYILSFFVGLILASSWHIGGQINEWHAKQLGLLAAGILLSVAITLLPQAEGSISLLYLFFCATLAICAMILPGISGAFILVLLGAYETVLSAVRIGSFDFVIIAVVLAGLVTGLLSFSRLLNYLFEQYRQQTLIFLLGILLGSIYTIWPWRSGSQLSSQTATEVVPGLEVNIISGIIFIIIGFVLVYGLEQLNNKRVIDNSETKTSGNDDSVQ